MTARTDAQQAHERFLAAILELDLDYCQNTYGVSPCTAGRMNGGTLQSGGTSVVRLATSASSADDFYNNMTLRSTGGTGSGQEAKIVDYAGATRDATVSPAFSPALDGTTTYDVIDRPNGCYNVFSGASPCQDKPNYVKGTKTFKLGMEGQAIPPGELIRPYIQSVSHAPTEIDPRGGLARSSKTQLTMKDEPIEDHHEDKYAADRATPAGGTFFSRLLARNPNYVGRFARLRKGYVVSPWDWATFVSELYVIDSLKGPSRRGEVTAVLKDPIKLADNTKVPPPTDGKLAAAITDSATSLTLDAGKGAQYGSSGRVRIRDEILSFGSRTGDTLNSLTRGLDGTTAAAHSQDDKVQLCKRYENALLTDVIKDLLNASSISDTYIDTAQMASEDTTWLSSKYRITVTLAEPEKPSDLIAELVRDANAFLWWHPVEQKFKFKANMPDLVTASIKLLTEEANLTMKESVSVERLDAERITYSALHYALATPVASRSEDKNYLRGAISIDASAESANEYGDRRAEVRRSRFLSAANDLAAIAFANRDVSWRRDAPAKVRFALDPRDYTISVGDLIDIDTKHLADAAGANKVTRLRVMRLVDQGGRIEVEARTTKFRNRYAFIAPNGTADYPTDKTYAHICRTTPTQTMSNGDEPYLII